MGISFQYIISFKYYIGLVISTVPLGGDLDKLKGWDSNFNFCNWHHKHWYLKKYKKYLLWKYEYYPIKKKGYAFT